ncbi:MAG TPA: uroporphyrinogen-III synthase, partial [Allosphingosinicella sp.]|nr:uroporphyrinogen-III synthase [Allosphingosinicella sp.]
MAAILLILRPQPGADASAARARDMGMEAVVAPLFEIVPVKWEAPDPANVGAVVLTSANAPRHAGPQLDAFAHLPCYAVGEATAAAAEEAGLAEVHTGPSDGAALIELLGEQGVERALHLCGRDNHPLEHPDVTLIRRIVYAAEPVYALPPQAEQAVANGALALLHSPRAAALFERLVIDKARVAIA